MKLLLDASAAKNIASLPNPADLAQRLARQQGWRLDVPVTVQFEILRQAEHRARTRGAGAVVGAPPALQWVYQAWADGLAGGFLPFTDDHAQTLCEHLRNTSIDQYNRTKATKVWRDSSVLRNKAVDAIWTDPRLQQAMPAREAKQKLHDAAKDLLIGDPAALGHISASLDWVQLGLALRHGLLILTDDQGDEVPVTHRFTTTQLIQALS
jgi:hypothetical protein